MNYRSVMTFTICLSLMAYGQAWSRPGGNLPAHQNALPNAPGVIGNVNNNTTPYLPNGSGSGTPDATSTSATSVTLGSLTSDSQASQLYNHFSQLTTLITASSYIAGLGFAIGAIMKFKMHKDNPTQVPIGTPISLVFIAAALLFLPSILNVTSYTIFGNTGGQTGGDTGNIYTTN